MTLFPKKLVQYMSNNFATDIFNRTTLGVLWSDFSTTWINKIVKIVNGEGETTRQKKMNAEKYKSEKTFLKILTERFSTDSPD